MTFVLRVNGAEHRVDVPGERSLLSVLRDELDLTGTKYGCGEGQCGACTVLLDGKPVRSCRTQVASARNRKITTIEGIEENGRLHPVQQAFLEVEAFQCAYCISGMIISAVGLLNRIPKPSEDDIRQHMNGNVCRCGTYSRIITAVQQAARKG